MNIFSKEILGKDIYVYYINKGVIHEYLAKAPTLNLLDYRFKTCRVPIIIDYKNPSNKPTSLAIPLNSEQVINSMLWLPTSNRKLAKKCFIEIKKKKIIEYQRKIANLEKEILNIC